MKKFLIFSAFSLRLPQKANFSLTFFNQPASWPSSGERPLNRHKIRITVSRRNAGRIASQPISAFRNGAMTSSVIPVITTRPLKFGR